MSGAGVAPATNHISDPWPSIIGTAVHAWLLSRSKTRMPGSA